MGYVRVDDALPTGQRIAAIPKRHRMAALGAFIAMLSYCSIHLTDGFVPEAVAKAYGTRTTLGALTNEGLTEVVEGGYDIPSYLKRNRSKSQIKEIRQVRAVAGRKGGLAKGKQVASDLLNPEAEAASTSTSERTKSGLDGLLAKLLNGPWSGQTDDGDWLDSLQAQYPEVVLAESAGDWATYFTENKHPKNCRLSFRNWVKRDLEYGRNKPSDGWMGAL